MLIETYGAGMYASLHNPRLFRSKGRYLFVLSHMRSYSTLLCHILGSHNEISGYAEAHISYRSWLNFIKLNGKVFLTNDKQLPGIYVLDKILHNKHLIHCKFLKRDNIRYVFLLRQPGATLTSIANMRSSIGIGWRERLSLIADYYQSRLEQLASYAQETKRSCFIESERILSNTEEVLDFLTEWLELSIKLVPEYKMFKYTGIPAYGDSSNLISKGRVATEKRVAINADIPEALLEKAQTTYDACRDTLIRQCDTLGGLDRKII